MMDKANDLVARGADRHRNGRLAEAESLYRRALRLDANHPDALNLLGLAMRSRGALAEGLALSARAMALAPDKPLILANYGAGLAEAGQLDQAIAVLQAALALAPADAVTWRNLGQALAAKGEARAALEPLLTAARLTPDIPDVWLALAHVHADCGDPVGARAAATAALTCAGRDRAAVEQARFMLAALGEGAAPPRAPAGYVRKLFDQFAPRFDAELEGRLHYRTPALLAEAIDAVLPANAALSVLDMGCGTGLSGLALKPFARRLEGVDLSPRMLDAARARGIYAALHEADLLAFLPTRRAGYDLIAAADVLNYLGDLTPALAAMRAALRPNGVAAFSLETGEIAPFELAEGMRYRHAPAHARALAEAAGFTVLSETPVILREERGQPVGGMLLILR
jgi:predicted TPR repeat methyltransferase